MRAVLSFGSGFRCCPMEFCESALSTTVTIPMFSHEDAFPASWAILFRSNNFPFPLLFVKLVYRDFPFASTSCLFICHYFLPLLVFASAAAACLALNFAAFSSSIIFFRSALDMFRSITYLGSCRCASS
jgi:hypothetical protein